MPEEMEIGLRLNLRERQLALVPLFMKRKIGRDSTLVMSTVSKWSKCKNKSQWFWNGSRHVTSSVLMRSWDQLFHSGHLSLFSKVTCSEFQQQCSWLNHNPLVHIPSFKSVIQWAEMSIKPAREPYLWGGKERPKLSEET